MQATSALFKWHYSLAETDNRRADEHRHCTDPPWNAKPEGFENKKSRHRITWGGELRAEATK
jgi:hypothetical protein